MLSTANTMEVSGGFHRYKSLKFISIRNNSALFQLELWSSLLLVSATTALTEMLPVNVHIMILLLKGIIDLYITKNMLHPGLIVQISKYKDG